MRNSCRIAKPPHRKKKTKKHEAEEKIDGEHTEPIPETPKDPEASDSAAEKTRPPKASKAERTQDVIEAEEKEKLEAVGQPEGDVGGGIVEMDRELLEGVGLAESHQGGGESGAVKDEEVTRSSEKVRGIKEVPPPMAVPVEVKPRGPVQVHPHLYLLLEPLQPIKAQPLKPRRERAGERTEESQRRSAKLRELEEELLGEGKKEEEVILGDKDQVDEEKMQFAEDEEYDYDVADDEELQRLVEEEFCLRLEEEELLAIGDELRKKIETEESEIDRLQQEIQELQYLRHDSDLEDLSSGSDSSLESEDEDDLAEMLSTLKQENHQLESENADLCQKIHEERMICLSVKLQIRLLQQKQLESSQSSMLGD